MRKFVDLGRQWGGRDSHDFCVEMSWYCRLKNMPRLSDVTRIRNALVTSKADIGYESLEQLFKFAMILLKNEREKPIPQGAIDYADQASPEFTSFYLQQSTKELAEDLDKARTADDFKGDALPMLIKALQQGTALFTPAEQKRVAPPLAKEGDAKKVKTGDAESDVDDDDSDATSSSGGSSTSSSSGSDDEDEDEKGDDAKGGDAKDSSDSSSEDSSSSDED
ncbi:hypothetical protein PG993_013399 [Apiospora rasikravindrae]|uniref:Ribosome assembly protein 3 n=1 Tax=Apiospora rasikravindrae TaxID=990691 RepID=A0ABR1RXH9_9PEZI